MGTGSSLMLMIIGHDAQSRMRKGRANTNGSLGKVE